MQKLKVTIDMPDKRIMTISFHSYSTVADIIDLIQKSCGVNNGPDFSLYALHEPQGKSFTVCKDFED